MISECMGWGGFGCGGVGELSGWGFALGQVDLIASCLRWP